MEEVVQVQSKKKPKTEAVRSAAPPKKKDEEKPVGKVEEPRKNVEPDNASDDDWDKPKEPKKDASKAKSSPKSSNYDDDDDWNMDDKDLGLEDKTEKKPETKENKVPAKVEVAQTKPS